MKILFLIFIAACAANAANLVDGKYGRFIEMLDGDGLLHKVDLADTPDAEQLNDVERSSAYNEYFLFTRQNPTAFQRLVMYDPNSITSSNFDASKPTVVVTHGWRSNRNSIPNPGLRDVFLEQSDVNVIVVDWSPVAQNEYVLASSGVPAVGRGVGQFLNFLNDLTGAPFNTMHLIGLSMGAHVVGNAGRELNDLPARITGLDPAGPLWVTNPYRLRASDGVYVEVIHTDGGPAGLGIGVAIARVDFFPNGGISQPGCLSNACNHARAYHFFSATITHNHLIGRQCTNIAQVGLDTCRGSSLHMGNSDLNKTGNGMFRVNTRRTYPY